jgi:peroxiredoxin
MTENKHRKSNGAVPFMFLGIGLVLVSVAALLFLPKQQANPTAAGAGLKVVPAKINFQAPDVKITDLDGQPVAFSDYRGQVILYNAWATWCPPCKEEMPTLQAYYEDYKDKGFVIIAVEDGEPVEEVAAFVKEYGLTFPVWPDPTWQATETFKINNLPTSYVIDREGVARYVWTGAITREMLEKYVTPLIAGN